jgi:4-amino-4-deoxychorismate lyase
MDLLPFHQKRVNRSRRQLFGIKKQLNLRTFLKEQELPATGYHKIRITYNHSIQTFNCTAYVPRPVNSLRIVAFEPFDYRYKYANRRKLDLAFTYRDGCDDIIISWQSYVTDTYYGNLALFDGQKWWTPAHPLLKGVRRAFLCEKKILHPTIIRVPDLKYFKEVRIINAMIPLQESKPIGIDKIFMPGKEVGINR